MFLKCYKTFKKAIFKFKLKSLEPSLKLEAHSYLINICTIILSSNFTDDCSDDDCYFYDTWTDPRKPYMDLYMDAEGTINDTLSLPNIKYGLEFYHGYLQIVTEDFDLECACPLILKGNKTFVTFHAKNDLIMYYNYKFPFSRGKDGRVEISCEYNFSSLLMNDT